MKYLFSLFCFVYLFFVDMRIEVNLTKWRQIHPTLQLVVPMWAASYIEYKLTFPMKMRYIIAHNVAYII